MTQAECLRGLERADAIATAAQASILAGFMAGKGYADDADYGARSWLIHNDVVRDSRLISGRGEGL